MEGPMDSPQAPPTRRSKWDTPAPDSVPPPTETVPGPDPRLMGMPGMGFDGPPNAGAGMGFDVPPNPAAGMGFDVPPNPAAGMGFDVPPNAAAGMGFDVPPNAGGFDVPPNAGDFGNAAFGGEGHAGFGGWDQMGCGAWPSQSSQPSPNMSDLMSEVKVIQIPAKQKGGLIGKKGEAIARIRQATGSGIKIEHQDGDYLATVTISGNVALAEQLINERLREQFHPRDEWAQKVIDVDPSIVGHIIGPGGANLRHIFDTTGCKIKFLQAAELDPRADPGRQVACVRGPLDRLREGEEALLRKIRDAESRKRPEPEHRMPMAAMAMAMSMRPPMPGGKGAPAPEKPKGPPTLGGYLPTQPSGQQAWPQARRPPPAVKGGEVIPCRFHLKTPGLCKNGNACPFSHDPAVIAAALGMTGPGLDPNAPTYKTTMCRYFQIGQCARGASCSYAHGDQDLRIGLTAAQQNAGGVKRNFTEAFQV